MEEKQELENLLEKIKNDNNLIKKLVIYLENNDLLQDLYSSSNYIIEKSEPICKIKYYKSKINGVLLNMNDVKNSYNLLKDYLENYIVYVYDEVKSLYFKGKKISKEAIRCHEYSKSYNNSEIRTIPLDSNNNVGEINWTKIIKENPLLFVYILSSYNIDIEELKNIDEKNYTYQKEIKKN